MGDRYFLARVPNWTNVVVSQRHGLWQVPVRDPSQPQPRDLLNAAWGAADVHQHHDRRVVIIVALESQRALAGYGVQTSAVSAPANATSRACPFGFHWENVFPHRGALLPFSTLPVELQSALEKCRSYEELDASVAHALIRALDEAIARLQDGPVAVVHPPPVIGDAGVESILQRVSSTLGSVLYCGWSAARLWDPQTVEPHVLIVFQAPTEALFSLKVPSATCTQQRGEKLNFLATEAGQWCRGLASGDARALEPLFVEPIGRMSNFIKALRGERHRFISRALVEALCAEARSRAGLRGCSASSTSLDRPSRARHAARLVQLVRKCVGLPVEADPFSALAPVRDWDAGAVESSLVESEAAFAGADLEDDADKETLEAWLRAIRLRGIAVETLAPLQWEAKTPSLQLCPWPMLVLSRRAAMAAKDSPSNVLLGVYAGDADRWLTTLVGSENGDRGWGPLSVRGRGFVLYELGRFAELIVWGHPFVLELLFVCPDVLHSTPEWEALVHLSRDYALLSAKFREVVFCCLDFPFLTCTQIRAIMQVMGAVQAQLKQLISIGVPFEESAVELAALLRFCRAAVVSRVGHSTPTQDFSDFLFWREDFPVLDDDITGPSAKPEPLDPDGPARRVDTGVTIDAALDVDRSGLREVLVELDELRPKWWNVAGVFPSPVQVQQTLSSWLVPIRVRSLNIRRK